VFLDVRRIPLTAVAALTLLCNAASAQTPFYQVSGTEIAGPPGTVIREEPIGGVVAPTAMPTVDRLATECIESVFDIILRDRTSGPLAKDFLTVADPAKTQPWRSLLLRSTPDVLPRSIPVFLAQGSTDGLVRPQVTMSYMRQLCRAGSRMRMLVMPNVSHGFAGSDSAAAAASWMADRFGGHPAPNDCRG
jgi:Prolyl oligopeptidase family